MHVKVSMHGKVSMHESRPEQQQIKLFGTEWDMYTHLSTTAVSPFLYCFTMSWWVGGSIRTCSFSFVWSRCCCCCCVLLLLPTTSVLKRREVPAAITAVSLASILLLLLLLRRDMHFCFLVEVLLLPIGFFVGCNAAASGACAAYNIHTEAERGTGYCFFLRRFCPLHCDASDVSWCCRFLAASISVL